MTKEDKILKAFKCALLKVDKEKCSVCNNNERQWGLEFTLDKVDYRGIAYKYDYGEVKTKGFISLFSKYKTVEVLKPIIEIGISDKNNYFRIEDEDVLFREYYREFFEEVVESIKLKTHKRQAEQKLEKEEFLNSISNC